MRLTENQTLQFVSLYKEQVCLWDTTSEFYKSKTMRKYALQQICKGMDIEGVTEDDVKSKIKSLRSTYYLELDKIKKTSKYGDVYQPKMKWFAEFNSFVRKTMVKRKAGENTKSVTKERVDNDSSSERETPTLDIYKPEPRKKSRSTNISTIVKNMKEIKKELSKSKEKDEFDVFGKYIASQLRKLSAEQAVLGQEEIQKVVIKCRLNDLRHK